MCVRFAVKFDSGPLDGDVQDLEEHEVLESLVAERSVKTSNVAADECSDEGDSDDGDFEDDSDDDFDDGDRNLFETGRPRKRTKSGSAGSSMRRSINGGNGGLFGRDDYGRGASPGNAATILLPRSPASRNGSGAPALAADSPATAAWAPSGGKPSFVKAHARPGWTTRTAGIYREEQGGDDEERGAAQSLLLVRNEASSSSSLPSPSSRLSDAHSSKRPREEACINTLGGAAATTSSLGQVLQLDDTDYMHDDDPSSPPPGSDERDEGGGMGVPRTADTGCSRGEAWRCEEVGAAPALERGGVVLAPMQLKKTPLDVVTAAEDTDSLDGDNGLEDYYELINSPTPAR